MYFLYNKYPAEHTFFIISKQLKKRNSNTRTDVWPVQLSEADEKLTQYSTVQFSSVEQARS
jgi:hypothetical protein